MSGNRSTPYKAAQGTLNHEACRHPLCDPCQTDGERTVASGHCPQCQQNLCCMCIKYHKRFKQTSDHDIVTFPAKEREERMITGCSRTDLDICPAHYEAKEVVKYYCSNHDIIGCGDCMILPHKGCDVMLIDDVANTYDVTNKTKDAVDSALALEKRFQRSKTVADNRAKVNRKHSDLAVEDIRKRRAEINSLLDIQEKKLIESVSEIRENYSNVAEQVNQSCQTSMKKLSYMKSALSSSHRSNRHKFIALKKAESEILKMQAEMKTLSSKLSEPKVVKLKRDKSIEELFKEKNVIGVIEDVIVSCATDFEPLSNATARKEADIRIKCADDETDCKITSIVCVKHDTLLLADNANYMLKMVDLNTSKFVSGFQMSVCPWDITVLPDDEIALTLPESNKVRIMSTQGNVISKVREFDVSGSCYGIDYKNDKLAVSFCQPSKVEIMDLEGNVLVCCQKDKRGYALFATPWYVAFANDTDRLFVSDHNGGICVLSLNGEFKGSIKDKELVFPTSLVVGQKDNVLACGSDSYNVRLVNKEDSVCSGKTILDSKDGIVLPRAICWSPDWKKMFVSSVNGSKAHNNYIHVFGMDSLF